MSWPYLLEALVLGVSAALLPGALQAFFLAQTLRMGWRRALPLALTPLLSDGPLVVLSLTVLTNLPALWVRGLAVAGGVYLLYLSWQLLRLPRVSSTAASQAPQARTLFQAVTINWLNPNPYLFWLTVLGPLALQGWKRHPLWGLAFIAVFYGVMVVGNGLLIWFFGRLGQLPAAWRQRSLQAAGLLLALFGLRLLLQGLR